MNKYSVLY